MAGPPVNGITVIEGARSHPYREAVTRAYDDSPDDWRKVLGDLLMFQWGIYSHPDSRRPVSLDEAGVRHLDTQLELAGLSAPERPRMLRILDLGCGWGYTLHHLAGLFPECPRLDGVNISKRQLEYCARYFVRPETMERISLYLDIGLLPDPGQPYDLAVVRGAITHFPHDLFEAATTALATRLREGGLVVISETLYNEEITSKQSATPPDTDHLAIGYRKSPEYLTRVLQSNGFTIRDMRILPSNSDAAQWLLQLKSNIEAYFPDGAAPPLEAIREMADDLAIALLERQVSAYSIIAERRAS
jgi:cyclopropane fatty-acyl-phospholipid synthase-like methyltransferase